MLHAVQLVFPHPEGGERRISAPIPDDMRTVLDKLGLELPDRAVPEQGRPESR
jgi:tRNA pseudouridine32 synthase/23S rRNA pseudouridine746 synthase